MRGRSRATSAIACELTPKGLLDRVSVSPSETKVCFEFQKGFIYKDPGRTLYIADFDVKKRTITNLKAIANEDGKPLVRLPAWIEGEAAVMYHDQTGKGQLYVYRLDDGSTRESRPNSSTTATRTVSGALLERRVPRINSRN